MLTQCSHGLLTRGNWAVAKLTLKTIPKLAATGGDTVHWDDELERFGLRITAKGAKSYFIKYRNAQGRSRYLTIGKHDPWTPDQARRRADELLKEVDRGFDPAESKREARAAITIAQLCDEYFEAAKNGLVIHKGKPKKASTLNQDASRISAHIKPLLGKKPVKDLTQEQVKNFYNAVVLGKTARDRPTGKKRGRSIVTGGHTAAKRCVGLLGGMLTYAMELGYRPPGINPASKISMKADERREFRLERAGWRAIGKALEDAEAAQESWQAIAVTKLLALTGCRKEEIGSLKWDEIDFENGCFRFGKVAYGRKRVKSGETRPIGNVVLAILEDLKASPRPGKSKSAYVFPGTLADQDKPYQGLKGAFKRMGIGYSPHCLRHAFGSAAENDCEFHRSTVKVLIGHKRKEDVTDGYIAKPDSVLLAAANKVSEWISLAMEYDAQNVIPFEARKTA